MSALNSRRKTIREGIKALLAAHIPALANRVSTNQYAPLDPDALPFVVISTPSAQREFDNARDMDVDVDLRIAIFAGETEENSVDDSLDHFSDAIEAVLLAQPQTLGGLVYDVRPGPQVTTVDEADADNVYGVAVDAYTLHTYFTKPPILNEE